MVPRTGVAMRLEIASVIAMVVLGPGCSCWPWGDCGCPDPEVLDSRDWAEQCPFESLIAEDTAEDTDGGTPCEEACGALNDCAGIYYELVEICELDDTHVACTTSAVCTGGRRPPALRPFRSRARSPIRKWATEAAWLEAASVPAFVQLARELDHHGAPELAARARAAARDEVRHARDVARTFAIRVPRVRVRPLPLRDLDALAIDNAVEGSREALGAAAALFQSKHADPRWRPLFGRIAADEARHAQLAWDIDVWLGARARTELRNYEGTLAQIEGLGAPGPELGRRLAAAMVAAERAA